MDHKISSETPKLLIKVKDVIPCNDFSSELNDSNQNRSHFGSNAETSGKEESRQQKTVNEKNLRDKMAYQDMKASDAESANQTIANVESDEINKCCCCACCYCMKRLFCKRRKNKKTKLAI